MSVVYVQVGNEGYVPELACGPKQVFDLIANRDLNFKTHREPTAWQAMNYWLGLLSGFYGVSFQMLPAPSTAAYR